MRKSVAVKWLNERREQSGRVGSWALLGKQSAYGVVARWDEQDEGVHSGRSVKELESGGECACPVSRRPWWRKVGAGEEGVSRVWSACS